MNASARGQLRQNDSSITNYLNNPELLEKPPEQVFFDEGNVYSEPKVPYAQERYKSSVSGATENRLTSRVSHLASGG